MGYMGFGMRKESYTGKPKKAFNKLKEIYGETGRFTGAKLENITKSSFLFEKHSYKPLHKTVGYRWVVWGLILGFIGLVIWVIINQ